MDYLKRHIVTVLLIFSFAAANAQLGIKAGAGVSDIAFLAGGQTPYLSYEINSLEHRVPGFSYHLGLFATFDLGKRWDFQPEVLFARKGLDYSTSYLFDDIGYKINIAYLDIPLIIRYKLTNKEKRFSSLFAGPYTALKMKAQKIIELDGVKEKSEVPNVKDFDFGAVLGYAIDFNLKKGQLLFDVRSAYSLINMMTLIDGAVIEYNGPSKDYVRNVTIMMSVAYRFDDLWSKNADRL